MAVKGLSTEELITIFDKPLKKVNDEFEYVVFNQENHCICIKFDKIFNKPNIKQHNIFRIQHKRYYSEGTQNSSSKPMLPTICSDMNYIFNRNNDSIRKYASIAMLTALKEAKDYNVDKFKKDVYELVDMIKEDVIDYVESNYNLDLSEGDKINTDLQVTDEMNKVYVESAIAMRFVCPAICNYTLTEKIDNIFYIIFREIMKIFSEANEEGNNPLTKLYSIVRSRVEQTKYANKKIWKFIGNYTNDMKLICDDFDKQLIESIIPKLDVDRSAIKYIDVVLRKKLEFLFTYNFPNDFRPLRSLENDDDTDERDRLNEMIFTSRKNEAALALNKLTIKNHIESYKSENDITDDDIAEFKRVQLKGKNVNNIQKYFLFITYGKMFEVTIASEDDRVALLYELIDNLETEGFTEIAKILGNTVENDIDLRNKVGGKKLRNQTGFLKVLNKYGDVVDIIENDNFIVKMIAFKNHNYFDENNNPVVINPNRFEHEIINFILSIG